MTTSYRSLVLTHLAYPKERPSRQDMAMRIVSSVNTAVLQIREALISSGKIPKAARPFFQKNFVYSR